MTRASRCWPRIGREVLDPAKVHEGRRQEAAQADVDDQAALDDLDDLALDDLAGLELLLDLGPGALVLGALLGEDEATVLVLLLENKSLDAVADGNDLGRIDILADRELTGGDDAFGLVADIEKDLIAFHADDGATHKVTVVEVGHRTVDEGVHLLIGVLRLLDYRAV